MGRCQLAVAPSVLRIFSVMLRVSQVISSGGEFERYVKFGSVIFIYPPRDLEEQRRELLQVLARDAALNADSSEALNLGSLAKLAGSAFSVISDIGSFFGGG